MTLAFLADENTPRLVVKVLRDRGHDVLWAVESMASAPDEDIAARAAVEGRILVTQDYDFTNLLRWKRINLPGLVQLELPKMTSKSKAQRMVDLVTAHADKLQGNIVVVEPARFRIAPIA